MKSEDKIHRWRTHPVIYYIITGLILLLYIAAMIRIWCLIELTTIFEFAILAIGHISIFLTLIVLQKQKEWIIFSQFTHKYQCAYAKLNLKASTPEDYLHYFNILNQELNAYYYSYYPKKIMNNWKKGLKLVFKEDSEVRTHWYLLESCFGQEFRNYINTLINEKNSKLKFSPKESWEIFLRSLYHTWPIGIVLLFQIGCLISFQKWPENQDVIRKILTLIVTVGSVIISLIFNRISLEIRTFVEWTSNYLSLRKEMPIIWFLPEEFNDNGDVKKAKAKKKCLTIKRQCFHQYLLMNVKALKKFYLNNDYPLNFDNRVESDFREHRGFFDIDRKNIYDEIEILCKKLFFQIRTEWIAGDMGQYNAFVLRQYREDYQRIFRYVWLNIFDAWKKMGDSMTSNTKFFHEICLWFFSEGKENKIPEVFDKNTKEKGKKRWEKEIKTEFKNTKKFLTFHNRPYFHSNWRREYVKERFLKIFEPIRKIFESIRSNILKKWRWKKKKKT